MEINYFILAKLELGKKQFSFQKRLIIHQSKFMVVWNRKDDRKEESLISDSHKMLMTLTWGVCSEPFWKKQQNCYYTKQNTRSYWEQPKAARIWVTQAMTDSQLKSRSVNSLMWLCKSLYWRLFLLKTNPSALLKLASTFLIHIPHFSGYS